MRAYWLEYQGNRFQLPEGETVVGRGDAAHLFIDDPSVSRSHATVKRNGDAVFVRDVKSSNGTFLNGERVEEAAALRPNDVIMLGDSLIKFLATDTPEPITVAPGIEIIEQRSSRPQAEVVTAPQFSSIVVLESLLVNGVASQNPEVLGNMIRTSIDRLLAMTEGRKQTIERDYAARLASIVEIVSTWFPDGSFDEWKQTVLAKLRL